MGEARPWAADSRLSEGAGRGALPGGGVRCAPGALLPSGSAYMTCTPRAKHFEVMYTNVQVWQQPALRQARLSHCQQQADMHTLRRTPEAGGHSTPFSVSIARAAASRVL